MRMENWCMGPGRGSLCLETVMTSSWPLGTVLDEETNGSKRVKFSPQPIRGASWTVGMGMLGNVVLGSGLGQCGADVPGALRKGARLLRFPHEVLRPLHLLQKLLRQHLGPLQTLGLAVRAATIDADQVHCEGRWTLMPGGILKNPLPSPSQIHPVCDVT